MSFYHQNLKPADCTWACSLWCSTADSLPGLLCVQTYELTLSQVYIWMQTQMTHVEARRGRMYGTFVHCLAFAEAVNRPYINVLIVNSLWSINSRQIVLGFSLNICRTDECCLPRLINTSTLNNCVVFAYHIRVHVPFAFRCKPGFMHCITWSLTHSICSCEQGLISCGRVLALIHAILWKNKLRWWSDTAEWKNPYWHTHMHFVPHTKRHSLCLWNLVW